MLHILNKYSLALCFALTTCNLSADETSVYCTNLLNTNDWQWAKNEVGDIVKIKGKWSNDQTALEGNVRLNDFFLVKKIDYDNVKKYCSRNYVPQPGDSSLGGWYLFITQGDDGVLELQRGTLKNFIYDPYTVGKFTTYNRTFFQPDTNVISHINVSLESIL
ncbi:hypothetical protein [Zooshikella ganghwensis]|uniref:hypothetical protein n=1 Tax=Zooshikella ganghwensis TaxID=202772 RepID=UPI000402E104|nr:hypothetical protein [Zooshikella ganghwensis]